MQIYINKNGQQLGPFEEDKVFEMLAMGEVSPDDFAIRQGDRDWQKLETFFQGINKSEPAIMPQTFNEPQNSHVAAIETWAKHYLFNGFDVNLQFNSTFARAVTFSVIAIPSLFLFLIIFVVVIQRMLEGLFLYPIVFLLITTLLCVSPILFIRNHRSKVIKKMTQDGIETLYGKKYFWKDLASIKYEKAKNRSSAYLSSKNVQIWLVFSNGKALIPHTVANQQGVFNLLANIPAKVIGKEII